MSVLDDKIWVYAPNHYSGQGVFFYKKKDPFVTTVRWGVLAESVGMLFNKCFHYQLKEH